MLSDTDLRVIEDYLHRTTLRDNRELLGNAVSFNLRVLRRIADAANSFVTDGSCHSELVDALNEYRNA